VRYLVAMRDVIADVRRMLARGERVAIATVVETRRSAPRPVGARMAVSETGEMAGSVSGGCVESDVVLRAEEVLAGGPPQLVQYGITDDDAFDVGLPCGGEIEVFVQALDPEELDRVADAVEQGTRLAVTTTLTGPDAGRKTYAEGEGHSTAVRTDEGTLVENHAPPPVLMIFGAVDTAQALCRMARQVGFRTIVSDARPKFATAERLPDADEIVVGWPAMAYDVHPPDDATYVVVLTHDPRFDEPALGPALRAPVTYIGALGSRRAQETRRRRLESAGYSADEIGRVHGPLGLDIGAVTPAETAVSILAEMLAVRSGREGGPLSARSGRITVPGRPTLPRPGRKDQDAQVR
jgi:xanthine dehydrogenase accessory factor